MRIDINREFDGVFAQVECGQEGDTLRARAPNDDALAVFPILARPCFASLSRARWGSRSENSPHQLFELAHFMSSPSNGSRSPLTHRPSMGGNRSSGTGRRSPASDGVHRETAG